MPPLPVLSAPRIPRGGVSLSPRNRVTLSALQRRWRYSAVDRRPSNHETPLFVICPVDAPFQLFAFGTCFTPLSREPSPESEATPSGMNGVLTYSYNMNFVFVACICSTVGTRTPPAPPGMADISAIFQPCNVLLRGGLKWRDWYHSVVDESTTGGTIDGGTV